MGECGRRALAKASDQVGMVLRSGRDGVFEESAGQLGGAFHRRADAFSAQRAREACGVADKREAVARRGSCASRSDRVGVASEWLEYQVGRQATVLA